VASADAPRNHGVLFARAYLDSKLAELKADQQTYLVETLKEWFDKTDDSSLKAYVTSFVGPVLDVLGHIRGELGENFLTLYSDRSRQKAVSLCYVVGPRESLDQTSKGRNYAVSLIIALKKIGLKWGIVANGLLWRLYCVEEKAPFETYFQVDLGEALRTRDSKEIFLLAEFFGATAFLPSETDRCRLDDNRHESDEETMEIEKHLESEMESILGKICMGFIESEGKKSYAEDEKRVVFSNSIYLLYRILFVLYAEARGLLPLQNQEYYEKSIEKLMSIARNNHSKGITDPHSREMWNSLCELFDWINRGNRTLLIPPYNGGLFDDGEKPYLANHVINDGYLSEALFDLGFRDERGNIAKINYNDLSVRPLGSLYEGILEYQLFIAPERMVRRKEEKVYRFLPETLAGKVTRTDTVIEKGDIYFSQSSEERKLTGSYYTPEDVVQYIVENSLGQYLVDVSKELRALIDNHVEAHTTAIDDKERKRVEKYIDSELLSFIENRVLSIKVLDPAMGSGHFLVNATHFLSNFIVESLYSTEWENDSVDTSPLSWRRRVVERCLFGVDLNDLATELAKLSLWLITADRGKPLTFLDHHLRKGNSLLGTNLLDLGTLPRNGKEEQDKNIQTVLSYPFFGKEFVPKVLQFFGEMEVSSEDIRDVEKKKENLKEWEKLKKDLENVADAWLATYFGYGITENEYQFLLNKAMTGKETAVDEKVRRTAVSPKNRFFHWWLEFPEVFFGLGRGGKDGGFDIVVGNPPYGAELSKSESDLLKSMYVDDETRNTASYFILRGLELVRENGYLAYIVPKQLTYISSWGYVRKSLLKANIVRIIDVSEAFHDVELEQVLFIAKKERATSNEVTVGFSNNCKIEETTTRRENFDERRFPLWINDENHSIFNKILSGSTPLIDVAHVNWGGPVAKYLSKSKTEGSIPCVRGREIRRYNVAPEYFIRKENIVPTYYVKGEKLLFQRIVSRCGSRLIGNYRDARIVGTYCNDDFYADKTATLVWNSTISLKYLLGLLNSRLISWFAHRYLWNRSQLTMEFMYGYAREFPLRISVQDAMKTQIVSLVERMLDLNKSLNEMGDKIIDERTRIEEEIRKTDSEIDELVYRAYGITEDEKRLIENVLK
jgi:hypothetical protein